MILIKLLILSFNFIGTVPADVYWEEEYIQHIKKYFTQVVEAKGDEAVSRRKEFNDVDHANDLSIIVGIGCELIMLLKCILVLIFLVLVAIVFVVAKLA